MTVVSSSDGARAHYDAFAEYYDLWTELIPVTGVDLPFYVHLAEQHPGSTFVELGVGTGRVATEVARAGARVIGVDLSQEMLTRAAQRLEDDGVADRVELAHGNFVTWAPPSPVAAAYSPYHTLSHLLTMSEWEDVFRNVHSYLQPGGLFCFNLSEPDWDHLQTLDNTWREVGRFPLMGGEALVEARGTCEPKYKLEHTEVRGTLRHDGEVVLEEEWSFSLRLTSRDEVEVLAADAGFEIVDLSGSFTERAAPVTNEQNWILRRSA